MKVFSIVAIAVLTLGFALADTARAGLLFKDNLDTKFPTFNINPDPHPGNDEIGRQTGSLATLTYNQAPPPTFQAVLTTI